MPYKNLLFTLSILCSIKAFTQGLNFNSVIQLGGKANDDAYSVTKDPFGNIYVVGALYDTIDVDPGPAFYQLIPKFFGIFIAKYSEEGALIWAKKIDGAAFIKCYAIAVGKTGNIHITGRFDGYTDFDPGAGEHFEGYSGYGFIFVLKLSSDGDFRWAHAF